MIRMTGNTRVGIGDSDGPWPIAADIPQPNLRVTWKVKRQR